MSKKFFIVIGGKQVELPKFLVKRITNQDFDPERRMLTLNICDVDGFVRQHQFPLSGDG